MCNLLISCCSCNTESPHSGMNKGLSYLILPSSARNMIKYAFRVLVTLGSTYLCEQVHINTFSASLRTALILCENQNDILQSCYGYVVQKSNQVK